MGPLILLGAVCSIPFRCGSNKKRRDGGTHEGKKPKEKEPCRVACIAIQFEVLVEYSGQINRIEQSEKHHRTDGRT
jgi:hypothetical protein